MEGNSEGRFELYSADLWRYEPGCCLAGLSVDVVWFGEAGTRNVVGV